MYKSNLKKIFILSICLFSLVVHADQDKTILANKCYDLAQSVTFLISDQQDPICIDKLYFASTQMGTAANFILNEASQSAKKFIETALFALEYAQYSGCNQYMQILHAKNEVYKLKRLL